MTSVHTGIVHQPHGQTATEYLPLEEVSVKAWVVDVSSRIVLTQTFHNASDQPTGRAKYVFPLPANAAVCAFELALADGTMIIGEVKETEEAARNFNHAVEQGKTAALVERVTDDIFAISVGSIPANTRVLAHLTFAMDLLNEALRDHVRLQLPMHIAERYGTPPAAMHNTSTANARTRVRITVDIQTSDVIRGITSPTHQITPRYYKGNSGQKSQRRMSAVWQSTEFLNRDFVIVIHADGLDKPRCFAEAYRTSDAKEPTIAMQLTLIPKLLALKVPSQEYIFIIDRSGSMSGRSIETAKQTLDMLLHLLPSTQTTFNIFSFGSRATSLWKRSCELGRVSLHEATSHVAAMEADYGGTEIRNALELAFNSRRRDRPAAVFLLTDGEIQDDEKLASQRVIANAIQNSPAHASVRLFVLGIGTDVSSDTCASLAQQGNGECLFALLAEDIVNKCALLVNAGRSKNIEHITVDWGNNHLSPITTLSSQTTPRFSAAFPALEPPPPIQQAPHTLTKIFSGIRFTVFAITSFSSIPDSVRLITKLDGVPEQQEVTVRVTKVKPFRDTNEASIVPIVHTLAARKLISELDNKVGPLPTPAPDDALVVSEDDLRRAGIVRLGLTYQLVSKHTSFVAVQKGGERRRSRGRGSGSSRWARSRLARQTDPHTQDDSEPPADAPTFLDDIINGVSSFVTSIFGFLNNPAASASSTNPPFTRPQHQHGFPGAYDESDSATSDNRGRTPRRTSSSPRRPSPSRSSINTFSSLSTLDGSSCSSCWTRSRSPSPSQFHDAIDRSPSPDFLFVGPSGAPNVHPIASHGDPNTRPPIPPEAQVLIRQMAFDGSFTVSPLLTQLVGASVPAKAGELGIDQKIWTTVVVVAYIKTKLQDAPDLLDLVLDKAKEFVEAHEWSRRAGARQFEDMLRFAVGLLSSP